MQHSRLSDAPFHGPSFEEIVAHFAPSEYQVLKWIDELRDVFRGAARPLDEPLEFEALLEFTYELGSPSGEEGEPFESVEEFIEESHRWGIAEWLARARPFLPVNERAVAAVTLASAWWLPVLRETAGQDTYAIERVLVVANAYAQNSADSASRTALADVLASRVGLPPSAPPPPYVGHFYGAISCLLRALVDSDVEELADCLSYAVVAPDGSRRAAEIAAVVEGR
jgi:hypothetical protein